jgi:hypothetical protein
VEEEEEEKVEEEYYPVTAATGLKEGSEISNMAAITAAGQAYVTRATSEASMNWYYIP